MWADILIAIGVVLYALGLWWAIDTLETIGTDVLPMNDDWRDL
jgi:uncharacterized membrane protein YiaA